VPVRRFPRPIGLLFVANHYVKTDHAVALTSVEHALAGAMPIAHLGAAIFGGLGNGA